MKGKDHYMYTNMDGAQVWHKGTHSVWFYLCQVLEQDILSYVIETKTSDYQKGLTGKGHEGAFWGDRNVLLLGKCENLVGQNSQNCIFKIYAYHYVNYISILQ
jgi:hypothetical protein